MSAFTVVARLAATPVTRCDSPFRHASDLIADPARMMIGCP
jgi:hypothetical protein